MTPAIVVLGYNRINSILRLLKTLEKAIYPSGISVPLIIDLDNCGEDDIYNACCEFEWTHGEKKVVLRPERMGLREHVLDCGDLSFEYGSIVMFEDDMLVSPFFYMYACAALDFSIKDERIGGVSLYNHLYNVHARRSFVAADDGFDNWYFQFASSWGQAYTGEQWKLFREWYELHKDADLTGPFVPANVSSWSEKSWLKYHICYLIDTDKYFMYPRTGYSTNCGDTGSHFAKANTDLQIPLAGVGELGSNEAGSSFDTNHFRFATLDQSNSVYDAFFENEGLASELEKYAGKDSDVLIDLYGLKDIEGMIKFHKQHEADGNDDSRGDSAGSDSAGSGSEGKDSGENDNAKPDERQVIGGNKYIGNNMKMALSSKRLQYKVIKTFGRRMRPLDANIYYEMEGCDFYLYDMSQSEKAPVLSEEALEFLYEYRGISAQQMKKITTYRIKEKFKK